MISWKHLKWSHSVLWVHDVSPQTPSAMFTEIVTPLPNFPLFETCNPISNSTISSHPHLFITPIKVDMFEQLLASHPNSPLFDSVFEGLHEDFWPFENFNYSSPDTWDNLTHTLEESNLDFFLKQRDEEIKQDHFSPAFGLDLLPVMYSIPIGVVPKPHSSDLCLVTDHSAGEHVLNIFITCSDSTIKLDSLQDFRSTLNVILSLHGHPPAWIFKPDVYAAYLHIPCILFGRSSR